MRRFLYRADEYLEDAQRLLLPDFAARHGHAFLLHLGPIGEDKFSVAMDETMLAPGEGGLLADPTLQSYFVIPLRGADDAARSITLGRAPDNDVVIDDMSLSKQHAVFELGPPMRLRDGNSRNGTFVGESPAGRGAEVESGQAVKLGYQAFTFLTAADLQSFVQRLRR